MLLPLLACALVASAAQGQNSTVVIPDGSIGVQFEFIPFSVVPGAQTPRVHGSISVTSALRCPMPVLRGDTSADTDIVMSPFSVVAPVPMPGANANAGSFCGNPLDLPNLSSVFVP
jgi:hypothetical protein